MKKYFILVAICLLSFSRAWADNNMTLMLILADESGAPLTTQITAAKLAQYTATLEWNGKTITVAANASAPNNRFMAFGANWALQISLQGFNPTEVPLGDPLKLTITNDKGENIVVNLTRDKPSGIQKQNIVAVAPAAAPEITTAPNICKGGDAANITISNITDYSKYTLAVTPSTGITLGTLGASTSIQADNTAAAGSYTLTLTANDGTSGPWTKQFTVNAGPSLTITPSLADAGKGYFCTGGSNNSSVTLTASNLAGYTYTWGGAGSGNAATLSVTAPGTYTLKATKAGACPAEATIDVEQLTAPTTPVIATPANADVCRTDGGKTTLSVNSPVNAYTYSWSPSGSGKTLDVAHSSVPTTGQNYTVTADDGKCKSNTSTAVTLTGHDFSVSIAPAGGAVASGAVKNLTATATPAADVKTGSWNWTSDGSGHANFTDANLTTNGITTTSNYEVSVESQYGCKATKKVTFTVQAGTVWDFTLAAAAKCTGETITLSPTMSGTAAAPVRYEWTSTDGLAFASPSASSTNITTTAPGQYTATLKITDGNNVVKTHDVTVKIYGKPSITDIQVTSSKVCKGETIDLKANGGTAAAVALDNSANLQYVWSTGATTAAATTTATLDHAGVDANTYKVKVKDGNGCMSPEVSVKYTAHEVKVTAQINGSASTTSVPYNASANLTSTIVYTPATGVTPLPDATATYSWSGGDGIATGATAQTATTNALTNAGTYLFKVKDSYGCEAQDDIAYTIAGGPLSVTTGDVYACAGADTQLSCTISGGSGTSAPTYKWTSSDGLTFDDPTSATPKVTTTAPGTYHVKVEVIKAPQTAISNEAIITIGEQPELGAATVYKGGNPLGSGDVILPGSVVDIQIQGINLPAGTQYAWTDPSNIVDYEGADHLSVTTKSLAKGNPCVTLTVTNADNKCPDQQQVCLNINGTQFTAAVQGDTICEGSTTTLTATVGGGVKPIASYDWVCDAGLVFSLSADKTSLIVDPSTPVGTYSGKLTVKDSKGNEAIATFKVKVNPMPVFVTVPASPQTVKVGNTLPLTASANPAATTQLVWTGTPADPQTGTVGMATINAGPFSTAGGAYPYTITATLGNCSIDSTVLVQVIDKAEDIKIVANDVTACEGEQKMLSASATGGSGTLSYNWLVISGDLQLVTNYGDKVAILSGSVGSHTVRVTVKDNGADPAPDQYKDITVTISRNPQINSIVVNNLTKGTTNVTTADYGDLLELVGTVDPTNANCKWTETGSDLQATTGSTVNTKPVSGMNTFTLTATTPAGCSVQQSVTITVNKPAAGALLELSLDKKCADSGESMILNMKASGGTSFTFTLRNNNGFSQDYSGAGPWTFPISLGDQDTYFVSDFKAFKNGLAVTPTQVVPSQIEALFHSTPVITIADGNVKTVCEGDALTLKASSQLANTDYKWDNGVLNGEPFFPNASGTYTVTATSEEGCKATSTVNVTMVQKPSVTITASADDICLGESVTLTAGGATDYVWNDGQTGETITVQPNVGGSLTYIVTGKENVNGCAKDAPVTINVNEKPVIVATSRVERSIAIGKSVVFAVKATGKDLKYQWKRWDGSAWLGLSDDNTAMPVIQGSKTDSLRLSDVPQSWDGAQFQCVVTNDCGTADTTFLLRVKECFEILDLEWDMCEGIRPETNPNIEVDGWYCPGTKIGICARLVLDEDVDVDLRDAVFKWTVDGLRTDDGRWGEMVFISDSSKLSWIPPMTWQDNITIALCAYIDGACDTICKSYLRLKATPFADLDWKLKTSVDMPRMFCPGDTVTCWIDDPNKTAGLNPTYRWYNDIFDLSQEECPYNKVVSLKNDEVVLEMGQQDTWVKVIMTPSPEICTREPQYVDTAFLRVKKIVEPKFSIWCEDTLACLNDEIYLEARWENAGEKPTFEWTRSIGYPYWNLGNAYNAKTVLDNDDMWIKCILKPSDEVCFNQDTVFADAIQIRAIKDPKVFIFADLENKIEGDEVVVESDITQMPVLNPTYTWYVNDLISPETSEELISNAFHQGDKVQLGVRGERLCQNQVLSNILTIDFNSSSRDTLVVIYRGEKIRDLSMFKPGDEACEFFIVENGYTGNGKVSMGIDGVFNYVPDADFTGKEKVTYKVVNRYTGNVQIGYIYIQVNDKDRFFIPNIITPNNDGLNDTWKLDFLTDYPEHQITIYNRNGKIVFRAKDYQNDWDGTGKGNSGYIAYFNLSNGIYTYVIDLGNKEILKGWVEIRRDMNRGKYSR